MCPGHCCQRPICIEFYSCWKKTIWWQNCYQKDMVNSSSLALLCWWGNLNKIVWISGLKIFTLKNFCSEITYSKRLNFMKKIQTYALFTSHCLQKIFRSFAYDHWSLERIFKLRFTSKLIFSKQLYLRDDARKYDFMREGRESLLAVRPLYDWMPIGWGGAYISCSAHHSHIIPFREDTVQGGRGGWTIS
jgi:hypothetical protein